MNAYQLIVIIQTISIFVLTIDSIYLVFNWKSQEHSYLVEVCVSTLINNIGFLVEITARNSGEALLGTKFSYIGKVFISLTIFLFILRYCNIHIPKIIKIFLTVFHISIAVMVFTSPMHHLYYTSITYMNDGLYPHNKFGHGIMYYAFSICMILYYLIILSVIFYTSRKERKRNKKIQLYYLLAGCTCVLIGLLLFQSGITRGYDTTSLAYVICIILITIVMSKYDLLDTLELVRNYVADNLSLGIVALDTDDLIIYYNQPLNHIYPDFKTNGSDIVNSLITSFQSNQVVKIDDKVYQPEYKELFKGTKYMGHIITLSDITDSYNYARLMKKMTETDSLTGLSNRFAYEYQISELKKNEHLPDNLILFSIDINGLKSVNDSSGHGIGDSLIYDAAQCISNVMTQYGKCFRMGGDG